VSGGGDNNMAKKQTQTNVKKRARYNGKHPRGDKRGGRHKGVQHKVRGLTRKSLLAIP